MLEADFSEAIICSSLKICEDIQVSLIGTYYQESGTVRSCRPEGGKFIVTIRINTVIPPGGRCEDPGIFAIESFLTEEQELQILEDLDQELNSFVRDVPLFDGSFVDILPPRSRLSLNPLL